MADSPEFEPIRIVEIIADRISDPPNDGTRGSALYCVPLRLSASPPVEWGTLFVHNWDNPRQSSTRHRRGIARISGDVLYLDGTTVEEIGEVHKPTLAIVLADTNKGYAEHVQTQAAKNERERAEREERRKSVAEAARRIKFD